MCSKCEDKGYTLEHYLYQRATKRTGADDYRYRDEACECKLGKGWLERRVSVDWNMALRMNKFIDDNYGIRNTGWDGPSSERRLITRGELADLYLSGKRVFEEFGGNIVDWKKV